MPKLITPGPNYNSLNTFELFDDFTNFVNADVWTQTLDTGVTVATKATAETNGILVITGVATAELKGTIESDEVLLFQDGVEIEAICRLKHTPAAPATADTAVIGFGFAAAVDGGNILTDAGVTLTIAVDGAGIYKRTDQSVWRGFSEMNSVTSDTQSTASTFANHSDTATGGFQTLRILASPNGANRLSISYWYDPRGGTAFQRMLNSTTLDPIVHDTTIVSAVPMAVWASLSPAATATAEVLEIDYIGAWQRRTPTT